MDRPISVGEAAAILGVTEPAILKAIKTGRLVGISLNGRGVMLCREQVEGRRFSEANFRKLCSRYVSVPDACDIVHKTDAAVQRDLRSGILDGFRLNRKAWAVLRSSAEKEFRDYLTRSSSIPGRKRDLGSAKSPRDLRKRKPLPRKK